MPLGIKTTVAESKESFALPPKLGDFGSGLCLLVEEHLQLGQFAFGCQPNIVAQSFDLLLELGERNKVFLFHLDDFFLVVLVLDAVQTFRQEAVLDVEHRQHDEVGPLVGVATIGRDGEIGVVFLVESILGIEVTVYLLALVEYLLGLYLFLRLVDGSLPQGLVLVELLQPTQVHALLHIVLHDGHHPADGVDGSTLLLSSLPVLQNLAGIPNDEILFFEQVKPRLVRTIGIRVILRACIRQRNFLDRNGETALHAKKTVLHYGLDAGTIVFIPLGWVCIRKET